MNMIYRLLKGSVIFLISAIASIAIVRIFIADSFVIPSDSMQPTLRPGDVVIVNKLIAGARIYDDIDSLKTGRLNSWRTRGMRKVQRNDILVFNFPKRDGKIAFKINYVYAKRCVALPGDTIIAREGYYLNNNHKGILGVKSEQDLLHDIPDSLLSDAVIYTIPWKYDEYPWTIKNFGPIYVPRKGDVIRLDRQAVLFYHTLLEYESQKSVSVNDYGEVLVGDRMMTHYVFKHNYYFTCGDRVTDSGDSRYWGFVPEEYIVGVAKMILYNTDPVSGEFSFDRLSIL